MIFLAAADLYCDLFKADLMVLAISGHAAKQLK
jgi:hypothetical protein